MPESQSGLNETFARQAVSDLYDIDLSKIAQNFPIWLHASTLRSRASQALKVSPGHGYEAHDPLGENIEIGTVFAASDAQQEVIIHLSRTGDATGGYRSLTTTWALVNRPAQRITRFRLHAGAHTLQPILQADVLADGSNPALYRLRQQMIDDGTADLSLWTAGRELSLNSDAAIEALNRIEAIMIDTDGSVDTTRVQAFARNAHTRVPYLDANALAPYLAE